MLSNGFLHTLQVLPLFKRIKNTNTSKFIYFPHIKVFRNWGSQKRSSQWRRVRKYTNTNIYGQTYQHKSKKHKNFIMLYVLRREHIWYIKAVHGHSFFQTCMLRQALQKDVSQRWEQRPGGRVPSPTGPAGVEPSPQAAFPKRQKWRKSPRYNKEFKKPVLLVEKSVFHHKRIVGKRSKNLAGKSSIWEMFDWSL